MSSWPGSLLPVAAPGVVVSNVVDDIEGPGSLGFKMSSVATRLRGILYPARALALGT
jgi:hypothetical protein